MAAMEEEMMTRLMLGILKAVSSKDAKGATEGRLEDFLLEVLGLLRYFISTGPAEWFESKGRIVGLTALGIGDATWSI